MAGHIDSKKWALGLCAAIAGTSGCMLPTEPATEDARSSVSVGGKSVWLKTADSGWPGQDEIDDTVWITRDDSSWGGLSDGSQVTIAGSRYAFADWTRSYGNVGLIELEASTGFWRGISTNLAIAVFHRSAGSRTRWLPVDCGLLPASDRMRRSDLEYYEPKDLLIDIDYREIQARGLDAGDPEWVSFEMCGVTESRPEFAAFVFPRYNWGNMEDEYRYTLKAWCDGDSCPAYVGDPTDGSRSGSRSGSGSGSGSYTDCRDPRAGANCTDSRARRDSGDGSRDDREDPRDAARMSWSASARDSLEIRDDGVACSSVSVQDDGDARDATLTLSGRHDYPRALRITLGHARRDVEVRIPQLPESGTFRLDALPISGFSGDASGTWKLCVEDTDVRHTDEGEILSWSVGGR